MKSFFAKNKGSASPKWRLYTLCLCAFFLVMQPRPAKADYITVIELTAEWLVKLDEFSEQHLQKAFDWYNKEVEFLRSKIIAMEGRIERHAIAQAAQEQNAKIAETNVAVAAQLAAMPNPDSKTCPIQVASDYKGTMEGDSRQVANDIELRAFDQGSFPTGGATGVPTPPDVWDVCRKVGNKYTFWPMTLSEVQAKGLQSCSTSHVSSAGQSTTQWPQCDTSPLSPDEKNPYAGADEDSNTIFSYYQLVLPPSVNMTQDRNLSFADAEPCPRSSHRDPVRGAAAYLYAMKVVPPMPNPISAINGKPSIDDIKQLHKYSQFVRIVSPTLDAATIALTRRVACPAPEISAAVSQKGGTDCFTTQYTACRLLKEKLHVNTVNIPEVTAALRDCEKFGLSPEAYDAAWAHRCDDPQFTPELSSVGDDKEKERAHAECIKDEKEFDREFLKEADNFNHLSSEMVKSLESHGLPLP